jgi:hypothetical protein
MTPYLSIVTVSRNDDHGGDPLIRTQIFVNCLARQCERYGLDAELIVVDWNPVKDRPGLAAVLELPPETSRLTAKVITVPAELHQGYKCADKLYLYQMIGKNVGIRRAKGEFIVATNIDVLFSEELMQFIALRKLDKKKMYRVDRYDIESGLQKDVGLDEAMDYAWTHPIRSNRHLGPVELLNHLYGEDEVRRHCVPEPELMKQFPLIEAVQEFGVWQLRPSRESEMPYLHTNACGDFTLLSREGWNAIRGYQEFEAYSFNIDSMGLLAAHYAGYEEISLLPPCVCFHIEHSAGSGWTPEGEKKLFDRLRQNGILNPEWPVLMPLVEEMRKKQVALEFNGPAWGLAAFDLPERKLGDKTPVFESEVSELAEKAAYTRVGAIKPEYDLDRLTLLHERRLEEERVKLEEEQAQKRSRGFSHLTSFGSFTAQIYVPDDNGAYSEKESICAVALESNVGRVGFSIPPYDTRFPLRFDPADQKSLIEINSIAMLDSSTGEVLDRLFGGRLISTVAIGGTARIANNGEVSEEAGNLLVLSTGVDPQIYLPPLNQDVQVPLYFIIEMNVLALAS